MKQLREGRVAWHELGRLYRTYHMKEITRLELEMSLTNDTSILYIKIMFELVGTKIILFLQFLVP